MALKQPNQEELIETYFDEDSCFIVKTKLYRTTLSVFFFNDKYITDINKNEFVNDIYKITEQMFGVKIT